MNQKQTTTGACFCGVVEVTVTGEPEGMAYCHCESCRSWSAHPVNACALWKPEAVRITKGADSLGSYNKTPHSYRKWCKSCGGNLLSEHPEAGVIAVYAAVIPDLSFRPRLHLNYQEAVLRVHDGLPKLKDFPAEMGGSDVTLPE